MRYYFDRLFSIIVIKEVVQILLACLFLLSEKYRLVAVTLFVLSLIEIFLFLILNTSNNKRIKNFKRLLPSVEFKVSREALTNLDYYQTREEEVLINKMNEVISTQAAIDATKKQSEYLALQNQINPHFLYNTLESIRSEALIEGASGIATITETLALYYRYTIHNINQYVRVEEEVFHIEDYMKIQKFRFGDKIRLNISWEDIDEHRFRNLYIPKLILQPIVENAVYHGLEKKIGEGWVQISFKASETHIYITISDNGVGMDKSSLKAIRNKLSQKSLRYLGGSQNGNGIALMNVNTRIQLLFGEEYNINLYSDEGKGTTVELVMPMIKEISNNET